MVSVTVGTRSSFASLCTTTTKIRNRSKSTTRRHDDIVRHNVVHRMVEVCRCCRLWLSGGSLALSGPALAVVSVAGSAVDCRCHGENGTIQHSENSQQSTSTIGRSDHLLLMARGVGVGPRPHGIIGAMVGFGFHSRHRAFVAFVRSFAARNSFRFVPEQRRLAPQERFVHRSVV